MGTEQNSRARVFEHAFLDDFHVVELTLSAGTHLDLHRHPRGAITMTLAGDRLESTSFGTQRYATGSLDYRPAGLPHTILVGPLGCRLLTIEIASDRMAKFEALFERPYEPLTLHTDQFGELPMRIQRELHSRDRYRPLRLRAAILALVTRGSRLATQARPVSNPDWLVAAHRFIGEQFHQPIALAEVACHAGADRITMARAYKRSFGRTVGDAIRAFRVARATALLVESGAPLSDIALQVGLYDASHLIRSFEAEIGMTPAQFRSDRQARIVAIAHG